MPAIPRDASGLPSDDCFERIDPDDGKVVQSIRTPTGAAVLAAGGGSLWSTGFLAATRAAPPARRRLKTGRMSKIELGIMDGDLVAADDQAAYYVAAARQPGRPRLRRERGADEQLPLVTDASLDAGNVAAESDERRRRRRCGVDQRDRRHAAARRPQLRGITAKIPACRNALAVAYGEGAAWVACGDMTVVRVDPTTDSPAAPIPVGRLPRGIAAGEGGLGHTQLMQGFAGGAGGRRRGCPRCA